MSNLKGLTPITDHSNLANVFYSQANEVLISDLINKLHYSGIPINSIYGDSGCGQFKFVIDRSDSIEFCDNITLLKLISKKVADDNDLTFSFMAKFLTELLGNRFNLKFTITNLEGKPASDNVINQALAGVLNHTLDFICFYAPNVNSYKRFFDNDLLDNWNKLGSSNDIQGINLLKDKKENKINFLLPGADANPYLSLFSIVESVRLGVQNKLDIKEAENKVSHHNLPTSLFKAVKHFKNSQVARESIGDVYHEHFGIFNTHEYESFNGQISHWELERYLYSI